MNADNNVWIDTDMGFDDLAAIVMIAAAPEIRVAGLSLVAGNARLDVVADNAARAAAFLGWTMPIHLGRDRPLLGTPITAAEVLGSNAMRTVGAVLPPAPPPAATENAVPALARHLEKTANATILALGPLTNIAVLLYVRPDLAGRIGRLIWMGGSAGPGNHTAAAEFNAYADPEAVQAVLDAGAPIRMVGLDACRPVTISVNDAARLRERGGTRATVLADLLEGYARIASADGSRSQPIYDPVAAAALSVPGAVAFRPARIDVELTGRHTRGMTVVESRVPRRAAANAEVATSVDAEAVRDALLTALAA